MTRAIAALARSLRSVVAKIIEPRKVTEAELIFCRATVTRGLVTSVRGFLTKLQNSVLPTTTDFWGESYSCSSGVDCGFGNKIIKG